jgi:hypothetical protein
VATLVTLNKALRRLEAKGYDIRQMRLHFTDHGQKVAVVLHLSPGPGIYRDWRTGLKTKPEVCPSYGEQNVGSTRRRNIETLLAYVEGLPDVQQAEGEVGGTRGGEGIQDGTP